MIIYACFVASPKEKLFLGNYCRRGYIEATEQTIQFGGLRLFASNILTGSIVTENGNVYSD